MNYDLNKIINKLKELSSDHLEIKSFGYGFELEIETQKQKNQIYPQVWIQPINTQMNNNKNGVSIDRRFRFWCYDLPRRGDENMISIWNDTEVILIDLIKLVDDVKYLSVVNTPILFPFEEKFGEAVNGHWTEVVIRSYDILGNCEIPVK